MTCSLGCTTQRRGLHAGRGGQRCERAGTWVLAAWPLLSGRGAARAAGLCHRYKAHNTMRKTHKQRVVHTPITRMVNLIAGNRLSGPLANCRPHTPPSCTAKSRATSATGISCGCVLGGILALLGASSLLESRGRQDVREGHRSQRGYH